MPEYIVRATNLDGLDAMVRAFLECAEWSGIQDEERELFERWESPRWAKSAIKTAQTTVQGFLHLADEDPRLKGWREVWNDDAQIGHDIWLTMNHHGAGFWDRGLVFGDILTEWAHSMGESYVTIHRGFLYLYLS